MRQREKDADEKTADETHRILPCVGFDQRRIRRGGGDNWLAIDPATVSASIVETALAAALGHTAVSDRGCALRSVLVSGTAGVARGRIGDR